MIYAGLDISKNAIDIAFISNDSQTHQKILNNEADIGEFVKSLQTKEIHFCCEYTGIYHRRIVTALLAANLKISVINPFVIKHFSQIHAREKSDKKDAFLIAQYCKIYNPIAFEFFKHEELINIHKRMEQLVNMRSAEKNRLQVVDQCIKDSVNRMILLINQEISVLEDKLEKIVESSSELEKKRQLLTTIPGIGKKLQIYYFHFFAI